MTKVYEVDLLVGDIEEDLGIVAILLEKIGFTLSVRHSATEKRELVNNSR